MPKEKDKYQPPNPRRTYTIMSQDESNAGKKSQWFELEITGIRNLSPELWKLQHLTSLYLNDNNLMRLPPDVSRLSNLTYLDLSANKLRSLPAEIGDMVHLRELLLNNNYLRVLPYELGRLFQLQTLGLTGNPLSPEILSIYNEPNGQTKLLTFMLDNLHFTATQPAQRPWIPLAHPERNRPTAIFTVMCYNVLCDKYCTRQQYGYCPTWALSWEYRKKGIIEEIRHYSADIISLQEVETDQFYHFFLPELKSDGYEGVFAPKSRARTMSENERKHVDGCAIFYRTSKFSLLKEHLMEFNQIAMASAEGSHDMLNRVMTKDNIGLAALLETKEGVFENGVPPDNQIRQPILVATAHVHWDPEYSDVKLIQTMMLMSDLKNFIEETTTSLRPGAPLADCNSLPLILCADLNSLPESGVIEYLVEGKIAAKHVDFKDLGYEDCLQKLTTIDNPDFLGHDFRLSRSYSDDVMPYTNYTFDFKGVIDYIIFSRDYMTTLGILGRIDPDWFKDNKVIGCPHPHIPSDHFALLAEFELHVPYPTNTRGNTNNFHGSRR
ncbi:CCR4-NOT transcription complex subunit 6-like isoform X3 [Lineus longissimus]|uniref:CCR4-NOT transcription complex subunit 6-like isoform X3 n=1 Tax=Lineus longissimus TaxID=88925 RepID=UPI002B4D071D